MAKLLIATLTVFAIGGAHGAEHCSATPYSVQLLNAQGHITVTVPASLATVNPAATLGGDFNRQMASAMGMSVVSEILDSYDCPLTLALNKDAKLTDDQREALASSWNDIKAFLETSAGRIFLAFSKGVDAGLASNPAADKTELTDDQKALAPYISSLPKDNFLIYQGGDVYAKAIIHGISADACGGFIRTALADNAASIQHIANSVRPAVASYVAHKSGPRDAEMKLWAQALANFQMETQSSPQATVALSNCKAVVAQASGPAAAAAASAPSSVAVTVATSASAVAKAASQ